MLVSIKPRRMAFPPAVFLNSRTVYQQDVHPAIVVIVEGGRAAALGLEDVQLFFAAASEAKINARRTGDVHEEVLRFCRGPFRPDRGCRSGLLRGRRGLSRVDRPQRADKYPDENGRPENAAQHWYDHHH